MAKLSDAQHARARSAADRSEHDDLRSDPESVARLIALRMLEQAPRTRAELEQAMRRRGVPQDAATAVLDRFTEVGLIDDASFASAWVDSRHRTKGLAPRALAAELRRKGIDEVTLREAVSTVTPDDERVAARAIVDRRLRALGGLPYETQRRRLAGLLARKGFSTGVALEVVREALAAEPAPLDAP